MFVRSVIVGALAALVLEVFAWPTPAQARFTVDPHPYVSCGVGKNTQNGTIGVFKHRTFQVWAQCRSAAPVTVVRIRSRVEYVLKAGKTSTKKTRYGGWETALYPSQLKTGGDVGGGAVSPVSVLYSKSASISVTAIYVEVDAPYDYSSYVYEQGGKGNVGRTYQVP